METFYTQSSEVQQIMQGLNLTRTLFVSSIIIGEPHTGKKSLLRHLFPDVAVVSGKDHEALERMLDASEELIITDFEKVSNKENLNFDNKRIIATANYVGNQKTIDTLFAFIYTMPSLKDRTKDLQHLKTQFLEEACHTLMLDANTFSPDAIPSDLSQNSKSLKRSVFYHLMIQQMGQNEIERAIYHYLFEHLEGNNGYKEHLGLYEVPLIRAGLDKYGSQLKLSEILGINRNTLRKKIHEHAID
jgi:DNA-binding NtrC family response regulator